MLRYPINNILNNITLYENTGLPYISSISIANNPPYDNFQQELNMLGMCTLVRAPCPDEVHFQWAMA